MLTFKDNKGQYQNSTKITPINNFYTVKGTDDELNLKNSFKVLV